LKNSISKNKPVGIFLNRALPIGGPAADGNISEADSVCVEAWRDLCRARHP
jgi:hypothetical protein